MIEPLPYLFRVVHILSAVLLLGGLFYAWNLSRAGLQPASPAAGFRPAVWILLVALLVTGTYNLMLRMGAVPPAYHMTFGLKFLLFLHIGAVSLLLVKPSTTAEKRARLLGGLAVSGLLIVAVSGALRAIAGA
jgi:uncharacterized membrane protein